MPSKEHPLIIQIDEFDILNGENENLTDSEKEYESGEGSIEDPWYTERREVF